MNEVNSLILLFSGKQGKSTISVARPMALAAQAKQHDIEKPKTAIVMLNMGGPTRVDQVDEYLLRIMTDRDMVQMPFQK